jgi:hypothetical protein
MKQARHLKLLKALQWIKYTRNSNLVFLARIGPLHFYYNIKIKKNQNGQQASPPSSIPLWPSSGIVVVGFGKEE